MTIPADRRRPNRCESYNLFWCGDCKFGRLFPIPDEGKVVTFYQVEGYYTHQCKEVQDNFTPLNFLDRLRIHVAWRADQGIEIDLAWFQRHFGSACQTICDLGCGKGTLIKKLQLAGHCVVGVEPDSEAREVAISQGISVIPGTAELLPKEIEGRQFDRVFLIHVLEHCRDPIAAIRTAKKILAPKGSIIIETPNNAAMGLMRAGETWESLDVPRHLNFFTPSSLRSLCEAEKLQVRTTEFRGYTRQFGAYWINIEQQIWDLFKGAAPGTKLQGRNSGWKAWQLLFATLFAAPEKKYDSVRVLASVRGPTKPD